MKRLLLTVVIVMLLASLLSGCTPSSGVVTPKDDPVVPTGPSRTDLNLSLVGVVSSLDPFKTALTVDLMLFAQIYDKLYYVDDYAQLHSRIALRHEISPDGLNYTFHIRKDGYFHNGEQIKASDVVFSFKKAMASPVMAPYVNVISDVTSSDEFTVHFTLKQAYTPFLFNTAQICIVNEKAYTEGGDSFGAKITGAASGPYVVKQYDGNTLVVLEAFTDYYRGEAPIKKVTFTPMSDLSTGLIAFENGELDFYAIPSSNWDEITKSGKYEYVLGPSSHISYILLNPAQGVLENENLRYAIQYAIDRDAINTVAYEGLADVAFHMMRPDYIFGAFDDTFKFTYDPAKVREFLTKAGYPNGVDIGVLQHTTAAYYPKIAQVFQAQLAEFGIKVHLQGGETSALVGGWRAGEFGMLCSGFNAVLDYDYYTRYTSPAVPTSFLKYQNTDYDADWVLEQYNKGAAELDPAVRQQIYRDLEEYIARTACYIPLFYKTNPYAWNNKLNVKLDLNYYYIFDWSWK